MTSISIITICKNDLEGLKKTIDSLKVFDQSNDLLLEHIIVDAVSNDGTQEFLEQYSNLGKYNVRYISEKDKGIYDAMNKGITLSSSAYVLFLNAGDIFMDDIELNDMEDVLESANSSDNIFSVCFGAYICYESNCFIKQARFFGNYNPDLPTSHQAIFFKKGFLDKYKYSLDYKICGDFEHFTKILVDGNSYISSNIILSKFYAGGTSSQKPWLLFRESISIYFKYTNSYFKTILHGCKLLLSLSLFQFRLFIYGVKS